MLNGLRARWKKTDDGGKMEIKIPDMSIVSRGAILKIGDEELVYVFRRDFKRNKVWARTIDTRKVSE